MSRRTLFFSALLLVVPLGVSLRLHGAEALKRRAQARLNAGAPRNAARAVPGELIVEFKRSAQVSEAENAIRDVGAVRARRIDGAQRYWLKLDEGIPVDGALTQLRAMPEVDYAEANGVMHAFFTPNDSAFDAQWNMRMVNAPRAWDIQQGDPGVVVAVLDTGVAYEDFGPYRKAPDWGSTQFAAGFNVFTRDAHANDDNGHGTHVASTIAEGTNNSLGVAGLAFRCTVMPVKVLDASGTGSFAGIAEGIDFAVRSGAKVINLSLGGDTDSEAVRRSVDAALAAGVTVVAAAGNESGPVSFPATLPNVIAVGAVGVNKEIASFSNFGSAVDLVAPGGDLCGDFFCDLNNDGEPDGVLQQSFDPDTAATTGRFDDFALFYFAGTSQATPHVAAAAALLYQQGIKSPAAIRAALEQTAEDLGPAGRDDRFGFGLVRPAQALKGLGLVR